MAKGTSGKKNLSANSSVGAPKKPTTSYFCYMKERREAIKSKQPDIGNKEIISKMAEEWKKLSDQEKEKYNALANKDKIRYANEMKNYTPSEEDKKSTKGKKGNTGKKAKKEKVEGAPKKPLTAFFIFQNEKREEFKKKYPDLAQKELVTKLSEAWKNLSEKDKKKYNDKNAEAKKQYEKDLKAFESKKKDDDEQDKDQTKDGEDEGDDDDDEEDE